MKHAFIAVALLAAAPALAAAPDWAAVDAAMGVAAAVQPDGAHRYNFPRRDLSVTLDGVQIKPALALGGWLAFKPLNSQTGGNEVMVMGDLVLTGDEVNPVMKSLEQGGVEITALHNHLLRSAPATMYMHVGAHGDALALAKVFRAGLGFSKAPIGPAPAAAAPPASDVAIADLDRILKAQGRDNGGVYQYAFPRAEALKEGGMPIGGSLGAAIAINFQPTGGGKVATTGDFVLTAAEVNPVIKALHGADIEVTALHNHMLADEPRLFFMHFWANGAAAKVAGGLRAALDRVNLEKK